MENNILKAYILTKYRSLREFSKYVNIPYTTIVNICDKDIGQVGIKYGIQICEFLGISLDSLASGKIEPLKISILDETETKLIYAFKELNKAGKDRVIEYTEIIQTRSEFTEREE